MQKSLLTEEIQDFISANLNTDTVKLALQKPKFQDLDWKLIISQITAKQKAKSKLPTWFNSKNILYPTKISIEQTSSEVTAKYKSELVSGQQLIDLTGGFGVDDYYFATKIAQVVHCEINEELSEIASHNFEQFKIQNIHCINRDSYTALKELNRQFNWIYIDPSRRNDTKGKVFILKDCLPNVTELLDFYFEYTSNIMIKTAPILDLKAGINELRNVVEIHIVAVGNEVKELLWILNKHHAKPIEIKTVNLLKSKIEKFDFTFNQTNILPDYGEPKKYLYEPNAAIMKSGGFDPIASYYHIKKLHPHSHLYTSDTLMEFPGRIFEIDNCIPYSKNELNKHLENRNANITTRNFPDTVETIRKKWKIKDGGNLYCFFTTDINNNKIVLLCNKLK